MLKLVTTAPDIPLLDERRHLVVAAEHALNAPVLPLDAVTARGPGAYLLLYCGPLDIYTSIAYRGEGGSIVRDGGFPIYAGSAASLRERRQRHQRNLRGLRDVNEDDLRIVVAPTPSKAGAVYLEQLFIDAFRPVWNEPWLAGFGSKRQGRTRERGQRVSAWNLLHPGRYVDVLAPRSAVTNEQLAERVRGYLTNDLLRSSAP